MKKITFAYFVFLLGFNAVAQSYSTGTVVLFGDYSGKIDVTSTTVTLTLVGPSTSWLGMGFDAVSMDDIGKDVVIFDGVNMTDRTYNGVGIIPPLDAVQNWTVSSNTIVSGVRTVVATRARNTGNSDDYVFPLSAQTLNILFARRVGSTSIGYHGLGNCGATTVDFTLGIKSFDVENYKIYPNPATGFTTIELPANANDARIIIYSLLGKKVKEAIINPETNKIDLAGLNAGSYLMNIKTDEGEGTKTLIIN